MTTQGPAGAGDEAALTPEHPPVIRSASVTLIGSAVGGVLVVAGELLAARILQRQAYGFYASGITVAKIGEALSVFGLPVAIFHFVPVYRRESRTGLVIGTLYAAALLPVITGSVVAGALWVGAPWLARHVFDGANVVTYIRLLGMSVPFMASSEVYGAITRGFGDAKYYVIINNLVPPIAFLGCLGVMARFEAPPVWITGAVGLASVLGCVAGVIAVARIVGPDLWRVRPIFQWGMLYRYSAEIMLNTLLYMIFAVTGILTVAVFLGSDGVGIYRMCLQVVVPFDMVLLAFHAAMGPVYPVLARANKLAELEEAYGTAVRWMAMLLLPLGIAVAWNRADLLALVGPQFTAGSTALVILAIGYSTCTCFGTVAYLLMLSGRKSLETWNSAFAATLNLVLAIVLIPRFGLAGAAFATAGSFVLLNAVRIWQARYLVGIRTFRPYFVRILAVSVGTALGIFVVMRGLGILQERDVVSVVLRLALMGAVYTAILWLVGLSGRDKTMIAELLPRFTWPSSRPGPAE